MFNTGLTSRQVRITSGTNADSLRLQIEDESSGTLLAEIRLEPAQIWEVLRGGSFTTDAEGSVNTDHIGKTMEVFSLEEVPAPTKARVKQYDDLSPVEDWARDLYPGYESYVARRHGGGTGRISVTMRRWV